MCTLWRKLGIYTYQIAHADQVEMPLKCLSNSWWSVLKSITKLWINPPDRDTSLQWTKGLFLKCPLFGGSTVYKYWSYIHTVTSSTCVHSMYSCEEREVCWNQVNRLVVKLLIVVVDTYIPARSCFPHIMSTRVPSSTCIDWWHTHNYRYVVMSTCSTKEYQSCTCCLNRLAFTWIAYIDHRSWISLSIAMKADNGELSQPCCYGTRSATASRISTCTIMLINAHVWCNLITDSTMSSTAMPSIIPAQSQDNWT